MGGKEVSFQGKTAGGLDMVGEEGEGISLVERVGRKEFLEDPQRLPQARLK